MDVVKILEMFFGLGLVIFVHELGHFLLARWAGVLVERFSIGFGPVICSIHRGDTEYALSAIPLGGYVKMLGQTDTPEVEEQIEDERSYQNKNVLPRMAIISAGVLMNVVFGFVCFVAAFRMGVPYSPAIVGNAIPGLPAWKAGLRSGDDIYEINGHRSTDFSMLMSEVLIARPPHGEVHFEFLREGTKDPLSVTIHPFQDELRPLIGVNASLGLTLWDEHPTGPFSPAGKADNPRFEGEDLLVAIDGQPIETHWQFLRRMYELQKKPVTIQVRRKSGAKDPGPLVDVVVEPNYFRTLGLQMRIGEVLAIQDDSPATDAKDEQGKPCPIQPRDEGVGGDVIKAVNGRSVEEIDPMRLPDIISNLAAENQKVELTLLRQGKMEKSIKVQVVPKKIPPWIDYPEDIVVEQKWPLSIPSIGIAYQVLSVVQKVAPNSPASEAEPKIQPGDVIQSVQYILEPSEDLRDPKPFDAEDCWPGIFWSFQSTMVKSVKLIIERKGQEAPFEVELTPTLDESWPNRMRGLRFLRVRAEHREETISGAIHAGCEKTWKSINDLYQFLRGMVVSRTLSPKNLMGPLRIGELAYDVAENFPNFVFFLGFLSINLAVINFLPIPILDGGHMLFLTYELFLRKPPSEKFILAANYLGMFLILSLMVFVIGLDILSFIPS